MVALHVLSVAIGLVVAGAIAALSKGTAQHRILGRIYVLALLVTSIGSFAITDLRDGRLSVFHGVSVLVMLTIAGGVGAIRKGVVWLHALFMLSSALMTVITGIAQLFDRLPFNSEALNAIVFLQLPSIVGFAFVWRAVARLREQPT